MPRCAHCWIEAVVSAHTVWYVFPFNDSPRALHARRCSVHVISFFVGTQVDLCASSKSHRYTRAVERSVGETVILLVSATACLECIYLLVVLWALGLKPDPTKCIEANFSEALDSVYEQGMSHCDMLPWYNEIEPTQQSSEESLPQSTYWYQVLFPRSDDNG